MKNLADNADRASPIVRPTEDKWSLIKRLNGALEQRGYSGPPDRLKQPITDSFRIPRSLIWGASAVLLRFAIAMATLWWRYGGWPQSVTSFSLIVVAGACLLGGRILRVGTAVRPHDQAQSDVALHAFGYDTNIALIQSAATAIMAFSALTGSYDSSRYSALVVVLATPLLMRTNWQSRALLMGAVSFVYLVYSSDHLYIIESNFRAASNFHLFSFWPPLVPYIWVFLALAAFPQLQNLSVRGVGPGRLQGDTSVKLLGTEVPLAFGSSLLLVSLCRAALAMMSATTWVPTALHGSPYS